MDGSVLNAAANLIEWVADTAEWTQIHCNLFRFSQCCWWGMKWIFNSLKKWRLNVGIDEVSEKI